MPTLGKKLGRWKVGLAFAAVTIAFVIQGVLLTKTINDVNHDRVVSCRHTYEGVREIFRPFFRPVAVRTKKEKQDIRKFNRTVDHLKARCGKQTGVKGSP